ncbi:hypothetical protein Tco_1215378 [Tanacetum coccineum]
MILELLLLSYYCSKIKTAERVSTVRERIKTEERIQDLVLFLKEFDLLKWDPTRGILQLGQQVVSELLLEEASRRYGSKICTHGGCMPASKVPMIKPGEFELWRMRIEQYIQMIDYSLWEVIENGNTTPKTTIIEGVEKVMPPTTAEEKA